MGLGWVLGHWGLALIIKALGPEYQEKVNDKF